MASLTNTKIKDTYDGLLKTTDNAALGGTYKLITDGLGNSSGVYLGTGGNVGIGQSSPTTYKLDVNGTLQVVSGVYAGNYFYHIGDTNTFFGFPGNDTFIVTTNNEERFRVWSNGYVGINCTPNKLLEISDTLATTLRITSTKNGTWTTSQELGRLEWFGNDTSGEGAAVKGFIALKASDTFGAGFHMTFGTTDGTNGIQERMQLTRDGNVQIRNVDSPTLQLFNTDTALDTNQVIGDIDFYQSDPSGGGVGVVSKIRSINSSLFQGQAGLAFHTGTASSITERMRIESDGDVCIGRTSAFGGTLLSLERAFGGNTAITINTTTSGTTYVPMKFLHNGTLRGYISTSTTSTSYNETSDYRLKENVIDLTGALDRVEQLQPKRFNFISDAETTVDGFIAHEVQSVIPEAVTGEKDAVDDEGNPQYQGIDKSKIVPLLVGAIKELKAEIETLKSQINS